MLNPPKIIYKKGVMKLNSENLFDVKDFNEAEDLFYCSLRNVKRTEDRKSRACFFCTVFQLQMGRWVTKEYFLDALEFCNLEEKDILNFLNMQKEIGLFEERCWEWYYRLNEEFAR